jgi:thioredoxin reductase (NADPH)
MEKNDILDLIIIGAGPAGLTASIYASRYGIKHLVIGAILGGQITETHIIDNYPGIEEVSGFEISQKWGNHAKKYGVEILPKIVKSIKKEGDIFLLEIENEILRAKTVLLATGTKKRKLGVLGEDKFLGKGVSYCATCDGFFYRNRIVAVIGGSDSAAIATLYLGDLAEKVYLIYRKSELRAEAFWVNLIQKNPKITVLYNTNVLEVMGGEKVEKIKLDQEYQNSKKVTLDGVFIEIGSDPKTDFFSDLKVEKDESGYIKIQKNGMTSIEGIFSAGDITDGSDKFRQVITACSEGAIAARGIYDWLKKN